MHLYTHTHTHTHTHIYTYVYIYIYIYIHCEIAGGCVKFTSNFSIINAILALSVIIFKTIFQRKYNYFLWVYFVSPVFGA